MRVTVLFPLISFFMAGTVSAADTVVLGHGIRNYQLSVPPCHQEPNSGLIAICMDANYVWVLKANRTLVGTRVAGTIRAIASQHRAAATKFVRVVELFVLTPINDPKLRRSSRADYYIVELSPRYSDDTYCLRDKPTDVGLWVDQADTTVDEGGDNCFKAQLIGAGSSNLRWSGHAASSSSVVGDN